jgi:hypothetical protein
MEAKPPFRFRKVRIAWSVLWGAVAVIAIVMWIRSYWRLDTVEVTTQSRRLSLVSALGIVKFYHQYSDDVSGPFLYVDSTDIDDMLAGGIRWQERDLTFGFGFDSIPQPMEISFQCWFLVLAVVSTATASWLPTGRFSLRTLLIATTLVAVVLGLAVWATRK